MAWVLKVTDAKTFSAEYMAGPPPTAEQVDAVHRIAEERGAGVYELQPAGDGVIVTAALDGKVA